MKPRRWQRIRRLAAPLAVVRRLFPLTALGVSIVAIASAALWLFALPRMDYVLMLACALALILAGLALIAVIPGAIWVRSTVKKRAAGTDTPLLIEAQRGFAMLLRLPAFRALPLIHVRWSWISPPGFVVDVVQEGGELTEKIEALERAEVDHIERMFVVEDAFGLTRISFPASEKRSIRALPYPGKLSSAPMLRSHAGGDDLPHPIGVPEGDRVDMRHYVPGDPLRLALWKVYARTGELMVRTPERAISPSWRIVAYLPATEHDEPAAAAARVALNAGLFGEGWRFSADGANRIADDKDSAIDLVISSRKARGTPDGDAAGLAPFLEQVGDIARTRLILFLPAKPGPWLDTCTAALRHWTGAVTAIIATDRVIERAAPRSIDRFLRLPPKNKARLVESAPEELDAVVRAMSSAGAYVVAVERPTGRTLASGQPSSRRVA